MAGTSCAGDTADLNVHRFGVGAVVVIERRGQPWKSTVVERRGPGEIEVTGGYVYSVVSGERLNPGGGHGQSERLVPATPDRLAYLEVRQFFREAARVRLDDLAMEELLQVAASVRRIQQLTDR